MPQPFQTWRVLPHGKLTAIDDNLLTVVGDLHMPIGDFPRRMTVARLSDGRLVIYSAIALDEPEMQALEHFGIPAFLVVPGQLHRMDAKIWKQRYPRMLVLAPAGAREKVEEIVRVDASCEWDFRDPSVRIVTVPGTEEGEAALVVTSHDGVTLVLNELIWNIHDRPGFAGWLMKIAKFTGETPHIPPFVALKAIKNKPALREQLEQWSKLYGLKRIIVSHGHIIENNPTAVLRDLASQLAA
jgi:hypothetical protein